MSLSFSEKPLPPITVEAVVIFNKRPDAMVLNRKPCFRYEKCKGGIIAHDGPFSDFLSGPEGTKAFAGRTINFPMKDGTTLVSKGQYWAGGIKGKTSVTIATVASLKKCYVFTGASMTPEDKQAMLDGYDGPIYKYCDYEKIIKFDDFLMKSYRQGKTIDRMRERIRILDWKSKQLERLLQGKQIEFSP